MPHSEFTVQEVGFSQPTSALVANALIVSPPSTIGDTREGRTGVENIFIALFALNYNSYFCRNNLSYSYTTKQVLWSIKIISSHFTVCPGKIIPLRRRNHKSFWVLLLKRDLSNDGDATEERTLSCQRPFMGFKSALQTLESTAPPQ